MLDIIIIGAGGFGKEVYEYCISSLDKTRYQIKGFIDPNTKALNGYACKVQIIGDDDYKIQPNDRFVIGIGTAGGFGKIDLRKRLVKNIKDKGGIFISLIHKTAIVSPNSFIGEGVIICPNVIVSQNTYIDNFSILNFHSSLAHDVKVGQHSILCPYATINGFSSIEDEVFLATHSCVGPGIKIGTRSSVSANSSALKNVPPKSLVVGAQGKIFRSFYK